MFSAIKYVRYVYLFAVISSTINIAIFSDNHPIKKLNCNASHEKGLQTFIDSAAPDQPAHSLSLL